MRKEFHCNKIFMHDEIHHFEAVSLYYARFGCDNLKKHVESVLKLRIQTKNHLKCNEIRNVGILLDEEKQHNQKIISDFFTTIIQTIHKLLKSQRILTYTISY